VSAEGNRAFRQWNGFQRGSLGVDETGRTTATGRARVLIRWLSREAFTVTFYFVISQDRTAAGPLKSHILCLQLACERVSGELKIRKSINSISRFAARSVRHTKIDSKSDGIRVKRAEIMNALSVYVFSALIY
jgi:hypothetical protein